MTGGASMAERGKGLPPNTREKNTSWLLFVECSIEICTEVSHPEKRAIKLRWCRWYWMKILSSLILYLFYYNKIQYKWIGCDCRVVNKLWPGRIIRSYNKIVHLNKRKKNEKLPSNIRLQISIPATLNFFRIFWDQKNIKN